MCLSSSFIMSSSLAQLSAAFSVLLAAITHFTLVFFQRNKHSQGVTFVGQFWVWLGKFPLGSKLISGGVAIRMSWCAFFEKINSRGGMSIPDWRVFAYFTNKQKRKCLMCSFLMVGYLSLLLPGDVSSQSDSYF